MDQTDLTPILTLPMQMVDRVDVLNASPLYGMSGANGVVNIITRNGITIYWKPNIMNLYAKLRK